MLCVESQGCVKFLGYRGKFWCTSLECAVSVWRSNTEGEFQTAVGLMKHEGRLTFPLLFLFGHLTFTPAAPLCLWRLLLRQSSLSWCYGVRLFENRDRYFVNDKICSLYCWKLKSPEWFMMVDLLKKKKNNNKTFSTLELEKLSFDEIFDCYIDQNCSSHSWIYLQWCSGKTWSPKWLLMTWTQY